MKNTHLAVLAVVALLAVGTPLLAVFSISSRASSQIQLESSLVGSSPNTPIYGIPSGGAPWVLTAGEAGISPNGMLHVTVVGLVLSVPGSSLDGTTGPVKQVIASLVCQGTGTVAASTTPVPLEPNGNAHINQVITLPSTCAGPIILVRISGLAASDPWIAATGFTGQ